MQGPDPARDRHIRRGERCGPIWPICFQKVRCTVPNLEASKDEDSPSRNLDLFNYPKCSRKSFVRVRNCTKVTSSTLDGRIHKPLMKSCVWIRYVLSVCVCVL